MAMCASRPLSTAWYALVIATFVVLRPSTCRALARLRRIRVALAVSLLKALAPQLRPLIDAPAPDRYTEMPEQSAAPRHAQNAVMIDAPPDPARDAPGAAATTN